MTWWIWEHMVDDSSIGYWRIGSCRMATTPSISIKVLITSASTGRRTNKSVNFMVMSFLYEPALGAARFTSSRVLATACTAMPSASFSWPEATTRGTEHGRRKAQCACQSL